MLTSLKVKSGIAVGEFFKVNAAVVKMRVKKISKSAVVIKVIGEMLFVYGLLGWIYGIATQLHHPGSLNYHFSHLTPWLRVDTFTVLSFLVSVLGFFIWRLSAELHPSKVDINPEC